MNQRAKKTKNIKKLQIKKFIKKVLVKVEVILYTKRDHYKNIKMINKNQKYSMNNKNLN